MAGTVQRNALVAPFSVLSDILEKDNKGKQTGKVAVTHQKWFTEAGVAINRSAQITGTIPTSSASEGQAGTFTFDANFLYVCVALNHWKRTPIADF